jgi:hypothetical protein
LSCDTILSLCFLFVSVLPLGTFILRVGERILGRSLGLTLVERVLVAFYSSGAVLFVVASLPLPIYGSPLLIVLLAFGAAAYTAIALRERGQGVRSALTFLLRPVGLALVIGTVGLLILEVLPISQIIFPNTYDGGATTLWINLTVSGHTLPWTLEPYAQWGVVYPLGTTVWMTTPVLLLGWSVISTPVLLLPLFLSLTVPAAFCWGTRLTDSQARGKPYVGLLFAAFFGLVASWPRLLVGGAYDFVLALPLLIVMMGLARPFVEGSPRPWKAVALMGLLVGSLTTLSPAASELFVLLLVASVVAFQKGGGHVVKAWLMRIAVVGTIGAAFAIRSFIGFATWFSYPGHVLSEAGSPPFVSPTSPYPFNLRLVLGELDPFVPWKAKLSPFPYLSLELQVLLAAGIVLVFLVFVAPPFRRLELLPAGLCETTAVGAATAFALTGFLVLTTIPGSPLTPLQAISSLSEASIVLFVFFQVFSLIPIVAAGSLFARRHPAIQRDFSSGRGRWPRVKWATGGLRRRDTIVSIGLVIVIAVPLVSGAYTSAVSVPSLLNGETEKTANVTSFDLDALEWVGAHLPSCSRVLAAPGSAAQFLPEYANVHLVYPMNPQPVNLSYAIVVENLTGGVYSSITRSDLLLLDVTEVFVTGQSSVSYPPFLLSPLVESTDFRAVFQDGDAAVLNFLPGSSAFACQG